MDTELQRIALKRLFKASADYYLMKETGECRGATEAEIKDEMAAALVDARLTCDPMVVKDEEEVPVSGECSAPWVVADLGQAPELPGIRLKKLQEAHTRSQESFISKMLKGVFKYGKNEP